MVLVEFMELFERVWVGRPTSLVRKWTKPNVSNFEERRLHPSSRVGGGCWPLLGRNGVGT